jgi:hypothetical protein
VLAGHTHGFVAAEFLDHDCQLGVFHHLRPPERRRPAA